jgi:predicted alpha/beta-hydrolase family hydrolase
VTPRRRRIDRLLLWHGAGGGRDHHLFLGLERRLAPLPVERPEFPYRKEGRRAPDRAPKLLASIADELAPFLGAGERLVLGGRSMGGRMCSMAVADGTVEASGLLLLSYPLHPPGKPDKLRIEHFPEVKVPVLFVSGTKDTFGTPAELEAEAAAIAGPVTFCWLEGEGHDPKPRSDDAAMDAIAAWLEAL